MNNINTDLSYSGYQSPGCYLYSYIIIC